MFVYTAAQTFSILTFDATADPTLSIEIANIEGKTVRQRELRLSELSVPPAGRN